MRPTARPDRDRHRDGMRTPMPLTHDLIVSDPCADPTTLTFLAQNAAEVPAATRVALAAHPNLPPDADVAATLLGGPDPGALVRDLLTDPDAPAHRREQVIATCYVADLWSAIADGAPVSRSELCVAYDRLGSPRAAQIVAATIVSHPHAEPHLAHAAARTLAAEQDGNPHATALLLAAASEHHGFDLASLPTSDEMASAMTDLGLAGARGEVPNLPALVAANVTRLSSTDWRALLSARPREDLAQIALRSNPTSASIQTIVFSSTVLDERARLAAVEAYATCAFEPAHVRSGSGWDSQVRGFARTATDASTLLELLAIFSTDARTSTRGRGRVLATAAVYEALSNPHLGAEHSGDALEIVRGAPRSDFALALASQPSTDPGARTRALATPEDGTMAALRAVARRLEAGHRSPAGDTIVRTLISSAGGGTALRPAARVSAHRHHSWPPTPAMAAAMLTLEPDHRGTLDQLLDTAYAVTA